MSGVRPTDQQQRQLLPCEAAGGSYCLDMSWVRSIQRSHFLKPDPADDGSIGRLVDGEEIPVYSLASRLGWPRPAVPPTVRGAGRILILESGRRRWGLLVDYVSRAFGIGNEQIFPLPVLVGRRATERIAGVLVLEEQLVFYLDPEALESTAPPEAGGQAQDAPRRVPSVRTQVSGDRITGRGRVIFFSTVHSRSLARPVLFGLSMRQVAEISELPSLVPVPRAPAYVLGLTNWRGRPIAVLDLDRRLGWPEGFRQSAERLIVARTEGGEFIGFPARKDLRLLRLPIRHRAGDSQLAHDLVCTRAIFELEHETLVIPDLAGIAAHSAAASLKP